MDDVNEDRIQWKGLWWFVGLFVISIFSDICFQGGGRDVRIIKIYYDIECYVKSYN